MELSYPEGSVNRLVADRLAAFGKARRALAARAEGSEGSAT